MKQSSGALDRFRWSHTLNTEHLGNWHLPVFKKVSTPSDRRSGGKKGNIKGKRVSWDMRHEGNQDKKKLKRERGNKWRKLQEWRGLMKETPFNYWPAAPAPATWESVCVKETQASMSLTQERLRTWEKVSAACKHTQTLKLSIYYYRLLWVSHQVYFCTRSFFNILNLVTLGRTTSSAFNCTLNPALVFCTAR